MSEVEHVVVIGGGVAGAATAYYLSAAGVRVTIVEREGIGSQASAWSAGGLNPLQGIERPLLPFAMESLPRSRFRTKAAGMHRNCCAS